MSDGRVKGETDDLSVLSYLFCRQAKIFPLGLAALHFRQDLGQDYFLIRVKTNSIIVVRIRELLAVAVSGQFTLQGGIPVSPARAGTVRDRTIRVMAVNRFMG